MELLVFGDRGAPVLVFPTSMGRFYQWEDFGLVSHMAPRIEAGWVQLWCVDSIDGESFYNKAAAPRTAPGGTSRTSGTSSTRSCRRSASRTRWIS